MKKGLFSVIMKLVKKITILTKSLDLLNTVQTIGNKKRHAKTRPYRL